MSKLPVVPEPWNELEDLRAFVGDDSALGLLQAAGIPATRVERGAIRLKPGPSALVTLAIEGTTESDSTVRVPGYALLFPEGRAREVAEKWMRMKPESGPLGDGVRLLPGSRSVLFLFPNDRHLRGLRFIATMDKLKRALAGLPGIGDAGWRIRARRSEVLPVRYKPERRFIARVRMEMKNDQTSAVEQLDAFLRFFPDDRGNSIHRIATTLHEGVFGSHVPAPLGALADGRLFVERAVPGESLLAATLAGTADMGAIVATLAVLYRLETEATAGPTPADLVLDAATTLGDLRAAMPEESDRVRRLLEGLRGHLPPRCSKSLIHGDLHPQQLIQGPNGLVLVDFERMAKGDPLQDLGNFLANLEALALSHPEARSRLQALRHDLVVAWTRTLGQPDPKILAFYEVLGMIELAMLPLRRIESEWRDRVATRLVWAEATATGAGLRGPEATGTTAHSGRTPTGIERDFFRRGDNAGGFRWEVFYPRAHGPWPGWLEHPSGLKRHGLYDPATDRFTTIEPAEDPVLGAALRSHPGATLVGYRATHRAVVTEMTPAGRVYTKVLPPAKTARFIARLAAASLAAARQNPGAFVIARIREMHPEAGIVVFDELPGPSLQDLLLGDDDVDPAVFDRVGTALARWHEVEPGGLDLPPAPRTLPPEEWFALTAPHLEPSQRRAFEVGLPRRGAIESAGGTRAILHGDLHDRNIVLGADSLGLLDVDMLHLGDPAVDLANLAAHLILRSLQRGDGRAAGRVHAQQLIDAYRRAGGTVPGSATVTLVSTTLFRLACLHAFRRRWQPLVPSLLEESIRWSACDS